MKIRKVALVGLMTALCGRTQEIGYVETFSLADDREAALRELVPGTDDFFYYHALHAQNRLPDSSICRIHLRTTVK